MRAGPKAAVSLAPLAGPPPTRSSSASNSEGGEHECPWSPETANYAVGIQTGVAGAELCSGLQHRTSRQNDAPSAHQDAHIGTSVRVRTHR